MPFYDYECAACGLKWDEHQSITAKPTEVCPQCATKEVKRIISTGTSFDLKGSGWAKDGYTKR